MSGMALSLFSAAFAADVEKSKAATSQKMVEESAAPKKGEDKKPDVMRELKLGDKVYTKVRVIKYYEKTGQVMLMHSGGCKGISVDELDYEQKLLLGIRSTVSKEERAKNVAAEKEAQKRLIDAVEQQKKIEEQLAKLNKKSIPPKSSTKEEVKKTSSG